MYIPNRLRHKAMVLIYLSVVFGLLVTGLWKQSTPDVIAAFVLLYLPRAMW